MGTKTKTTQNPANGQTLQNFRNQTARHKPTQTSTTRVLHKRKTPRPSHSTVSHTSETARESPSSLSIVILHGHDFSVKTHTREFHLISLDEAHRRRTPVNLKGLRDHFRERKSFFSRERKCVCVFVERLQDPVARKSTPRRKIPSSKPYCFSIFFCKTSLYLLLLLLPSSLLSFCMLCAGFWARGCVFRVWSGEFQSCWLFRD